MGFPSKKRLTLAKVLEILAFFSKDDEKDPMKFPTPPQEGDNILSEE